ncbi:hypothetical protein C7M84_014876 [Penaeus vannamei]|uniref:CUB domain-containing protein n=1 Tax=Penaeus vannamei TaxID=6689 RepID=A0A3R7M4M1_PENVA|nr:hypothetical protein C7M84_014876 [Penaeus vannamei]
MKTTAEEGRSRFSESLRNPRLLVRNGNFLRLRSFLLAHLRTFGSSFSFNLYPPLPPIILFCYISLFPHSFPSRTSVLHTYIPFNPPFPHSPAPFLLSFPLSTQPFLAPLATFYSGVGGCEGDHVSIEEPELAERGGRWCGEGSGLNVYYSETDTVSVTLQAASTTQGEYFDNPLKFKIRYKFLPREQAVVRYGRGGVAKYRGEGVRNTVCSRVFQGCRARQCRLQSPNFPGLYPRNVTCYYLVKALPPPASGFTPVITLRQDNDRLVQVGRQGPVGRVSPESRLLQDNECRGPEDFLLVYDGGSMKAPLLAKLCGTATVPNITSSGPEVLVVFQTATSGRMNHLPNLVTGFELEAHVLYINQEASNINGLQCKQTIKSFGGTNGIVASPVFAVPPNASCSYQFEGRRGEVVWIYFTKYHKARKKQGMMGHHPCRNRLAIFDGKPFTGTPPDASELMANYCDEQLPPICVRSRQKGTVSQPCTLKESFLSTGTNLAVTQDFTDGTSLLPLDYSIYYEFVTVSLEGIEPGTDCDIEFSSSRARSGHFNSPKNVFLYGRGGKSSLSCKYTFKTEKGEAIKLRLTSVGFRGNMCKTVYNFQTNLYDCIARLPGSATLEVWEEPWRQTRLPLGCVCDGGLAPASFVSHTRLLQLDFTIKEMSWSQDFNDFYFDAEYEFIKTKGCDEQKILNGSTGSILIGDKKELEESGEEGSNEKCNDYPWRINARDNSHLYLNIPGYHASSQRCSTRNRVVVFGSHTARPLRSACPEPNVADSVDIFSSGWTTQLDMLEPLPESLIVRYLGREPGVYKLTWLEVRREPRPSALESLKGGAGRRHITGATCGHQCPELDACISPELWCDGVKHCPSGADELRSTCLYFTIPWLYLILGAVGVLLALLVFASALVAVRVYQRGKVKRKKKKEAQRLMTREVILPMNFHKENIY